MNDEQIPQENDETQSPSPEERANETSLTRSKQKKDQLEELSDLIVERAVSAHPTLRAVLSGTVEVFIKDRPFRVLFDFVSNPPKRLAAGAKESDCTIESDERTFFRIHHGELNPQLAMVSDKVAVKGKSGLAVYFFNLLGE